MNELPKRQRVSDVHHCIDRFEEHGKVRRDRPYYVLEMTDGFQLNFHRTLLEIQLPGQAAFATFVAEHAHLSVETDDPYP